MIRISVNLVFFIKFKLDINYLGTNVNNQGYRPILVSLNAIDYWLAGGLNPVYYHADIFLFYICLLVLLFFFFKNIFNNAEKEIGNWQLAIGKVSKSPVL